jgi:hypothetical protein
MIKKKCCRCCCCYCRKGKETSRPPSTDSVLYLSHPNFPDIELGKHFGEWSDETKGRKIVRWTSCGPKSYVYEYEDGETVVRQKGISSNFSAQLDSDTMRDLTLGRVEGLSEFHSRSDQSELLHSVARKRKAPCIVFPQFRLERSLAGRVWETKNYCKTVSFKFVKRKLLVPTEKEKEEARKTYSHPIVQMAKIIARCERSTPFGFGESHDNDKRMFVYARKRVNIDKGSGVSDSDSCDWRDSDFDTTDEDE